MICPSCGREVVIATDLCPWCGCRHDFDGSIVKTGPVLHGADEDCAARRERRSARRERVNIARARAAAAEKRETAPKPIPGTDGWAPPRQGMRWYHFVVNVLLVLTGAVCLFLFASSIMSFAAAVSVWGELYLRVPVLLLTEPLLMAAYLICTVLAFRARAALKLGRRSGLRLYLAVILVPPAARLISALAMSGGGIWYSSMGSISLELIAAIVYATLNYSYFRRRTEN